ncbi:MAG: response regulator [Bacteroidales bacterium]|nr:response regulator [Bacteroidales bacterium]MBN2757852.1 response regulator [Bacteroidales bacterium]
MSKKKILIVEDDKMLCAIFEMFIMELEYELVGISQNGKEALKICGINKPDVILMDIYLDGKITGIETAKLIYEKYDIPVIFITSDIKEKTIREATYKNTYGFLMKPIYKSSLGVAIEFAYSKHLFDKKSA